MSKNKRTTEEILEGIMGTHAVNGFGKHYKTCSCGGCQYLRERLPRVISELSAHYREKFLALLPKKRKHCEWCKYYWGIKEECNCGARGWNKCHGEMEKAVREGI